MNSRDTIFLLIGAAVGAAFTYYYLKRERIQDQDETVNSANGESTADEVNGSPALRERSSIDDYKEVKEKTGTKQYNKIVSMYDPADSEHPTDDEEEDDAEYDKYRSPEVITAEKYGDDRETEDLYYFTEDDVVTDKDQEPLPEGEEKRFLGDTLEDSGFKYNGAPVVWVRNYRLKIDFQVTKVNGSIV